MQIFLNALYCPHHVRFSSQTPDPVAPKKPQQRRTLADQIAVWRSMTVAMDPEKVVIFNVQCPPTYGTPIADNFTYTVKLADDKIYHRHKRPTASYANPTPPITLAYDGKAKNSTLVFNLDSINPYIGLGNKRIKPTTKGPELKKLFDEMKQAFLLIDAKALQQAEALKPH
jgi:hypothetical protein